jgi:hypothetical protein
MSKEEQNKALVGRWFTEFWGPKVNLDVVMNSPLRAWCCNILCMHRVGVLPPSIHCPLQLAWQAEAEITITASTGRSEMCPKLYSLGGAVVAFVLCSAEFLGKSDEKPFRPVLVEPTEGLLAKHTRPVARISSLRN